jgi:hypothetical protein
MDVKRAFTYMFYDPSWVPKLGIAMLLSLPLAGLWLVYAAVRNIGGPLGPPLLAAVVSLAAVPLLGFCLRITRRVVAGSDLPLPEWSDVGGVMRDGLKLWVVTSMWWLPVTVIGFVEDVLSPGTGDDGPLALRGLAAVAGFVVLIVQPAAEARLAATESVTAGIDVTAAIHTVRRNLGGYLLLLVIALVIACIGLAAGVGLSAGLVWLAWNAVGGQPRVGDILIIVFLLAASYAGFVFAHLSGQAYTQANRIPAPAPSVRTRRKAEPPGPVRRRSSRTRTRDRSEGGAP